MNTTPANLFTDIPAVLPDEFMETILSGPHVRLERIVSRGHCSPQGFWYDQAWDEWVLVVRGRAGLEIEGQAPVLELGPGDHLLIPAHARHRVAWTDSRQETIWLALHIQSKSNL